MATLASSWWSWIVPLSWQVACLAGTLLLLERGLPRLGRLRLPALAWGLLLLKFCLPPSLASPLSVVQLAGLDSTARRAFVAPAAGAQAALGLPALAFAAWLVGLAGWTLVGVWRRARLQRELRTHAPLRDARTLALARRAAERVGLRTLPRLLLSTGAAGPCVQGLMSPCVVLPRRLVCRAGARQLEHVLLHEFTHIRRHDPLASALCRLVQLVFWFHPVAWLMRGRLELARELACDRRVAASLARSARAYRLTLLELARTPLPFGGSSAGAGSGFLRGRAALLVRLDALELAEERGFRDPGRATRALVSLTLALALLPLAPSRAAASALQPAPAARGPLPELSQARGCLQLRFTVLAHVAAQRAASLQ